MSTVVIVIRITVGMAVFEENVDIIVIFIHKIRTSISTSKAFVDDAMYKLGTVP